MDTQKRAENKIDSELVSRILRTVPIPEAFLFFTDIGQYNGEFASSLSDFYEKLNTVPLKSIEFHFKRRDFERWARETLGDKYLADKISKIDRPTQTEKLRTSIQRTVKSRLNQLELSTTTKRR